jgi:hypothetical protein
MDGDKQYSSYTSDNEDQTTLQFAAVQSVYSAQRCIDRLIFMRTFAAWKVLLSPNTTTLLAAEGIPLIH